MIDLIRSKKERPKAAEEAVQPGRNIIRDSPGKRRNRWPPPDAVTQGYQGNLEITNFDQKPVNLRGPSCVLVV